MRAAARDRLRRRTAGHLAAAALALHAGGASAAAYLPGGAEPDPPTGEVRTATASDAPAGQGLRMRWGLAPIRYSGTLSLDARWLRLEQGTTSRQGTLQNDIEFWTHIWQPWFIQLRAGTGVVVARNTLSGEGSGTNSGASGSSSLTGRFAVSVFPASRFPFELRADASDSRTRGDFLGTDYRSKRVSLTQSYRPETGSDSYSLNLDWSRLNGSDGSEDTVRSVHASALRQFTTQSFELTGSRVENERTDTGESSRYDTLSARHNYHPSSELVVDTLATRNDVTLHSGAQTGLLGFGSDVRQLSSFATWRPRFGEAGSAQDSSLYFTGNVRLADARIDSGGDEQQVRSVNSALGVSLDLTREWRLAASLAGTLIEPDNGQSTRLGNANVLVNWTSQGVALGAWRYTPTAAANLGVARGGGVGQRYTVASQLGHGVARGVPLGQGHSLSLNLNQTLGLVEDSLNRSLSRTLGHSASLFWQGTSGAATQSFAGLSASDTRTYGEESGSFQLVNLQISRRTQLTRSASWSGHLTLQASRSELRQLDLVSGQVRAAGVGWQRFYSGTLNYENSRALGVPRLRYTLLVGANSQQFESRALGDIDAPRQRIGASVENRLDYAIGKLDARLSARVVRLESRNVASVFARVQRRY